MTTTQTVKISKELFGMLVKYFLLGVRDEAEEAAIQQELEAKMDALAKRQAFSTYKNSSLPSGERAAALQKYLQSQKAAEDAF